jgi:hypothetical protein
LPQKILKIITSSNKQKYLNKIIIHKSQIYNYYVEIDNLKNKLNIKNKDDKTNEFFEEKKKIISKFKTVSKNTYNILVIFSTNVAEASITIEGLKYVFETGYFNFVKYDVKYKSFINSIVQISESSRIQRKGRVGRTSDGIVIYGYKKNARL